MLGNQADAQSSNDKQYEKFIESVGFSAPRSDSTNRSMLRGYNIAFLTATATAFEPVGRPRMPRSHRLVMSAASDDLFSAYAAKAPPVQGRLSGRCWDIVDRVLEVTVPDAQSDATAFDGALEAFVAAGPDDPSLIPEEQRALVTSLSDTAASYSVLKDSKCLSWGTRYRTLNAPLGAFFCGISLWPKTTVDVPNFTLYFGSGSAVNPDRVFMRLECIPRVDTDMNAAYAEKYYAPFNPRYFAFLHDADFEPYVSDSAYARGAQSPSGLRYFFDGTEANMELVTATALELAGQWANFVDSAADLTPETAEAMAKRDAIIRRVAAENSPDNANRERVFGSTAFARTKALLSGDGSLR